MVVVTINGQIGSNGPEIGTRVAQELEIDYVDQLILAEAAKRIGTTVETLEARDEGALGLKDRIARLVHGFLEKSALAGGDPYFGMGLEVLLARSYEEMAQEPATRAQELDDRRFMEVTRMVVCDLAQRGGVVIMGRGSNMILKDLPHVLHVGLIAPLEYKIQNIAAREKVDRGTAERIALERERARVAYFKRFFKVHPDDPGYYHMVINTGRVPPPQAAKIIARAALALE